MQNKAHRNFNRNIILLFIVGMTVLFSSIWTMSNINSSIEELNSLEMNDAARHKYEVVTQQLELLQKDYNYLNEGDSLFILNDKNLIKADSKLITLGLHPIKKVDTYLDLSKLNDYIANRRFGERSYFELYDKNGLCYISPEAKNVGKVFNISDLKKKDNLVSKSDFLLLDVYVKTYPSNVLFKDAIIVVSVPVFTFEADVRRLSNHSLLLGIGNMLIISLLLYFFLREQRKREHLELRSIQIENEQNKIKYLHLREQFNPHFLFNALGSLTHLIGKDNELSKKFIVKMTKFYRKIIQPDAKELASIHDEIEIAKDYIFLQKIRFGESISEIQYNLPDYVLNLKVPRFSIQMLFENAINNSQFSLNTPLNITINFDHELKSLKIVNTFISKSSTFLDHNVKSLVLLKSIYHYYGTDKFEYEIIGDNFSVTLPLIEE
ncbi:sensor histidine kinase [Sphingobacterium faecium]